MFEDGKICDNWEHVIINNECDEVEEGFELDSPL